MSLDGLALCRGRPSVISLARDSRTSQSILRMYLLCACACAFSCLKFPKEAKIKFPEDFVPASQKPVISCSAWPMSVKLQL